MKQIFTLAALTLISLLVDAKTVAAPKIIKVVNGVSWMSALAGTYANGCTEDDNCTSESNSEAAQACAAFGARLPTFNEYNELIRNYKGRFNENTLGPRLTADGIKAMQSEFDDMYQNSLPTWFWTSPVEFVDQAYRFRSYDGTAYDTFLRYRKGFVRCVQ